MPVVVSVDVGGTGADSAANARLNLGVSSSSTTNAAYAAANTAANTVRVFANSASSQNSVSLNFVNSATIGVTVDPGSTGNANISFNTIGAGNTVAKSGDIMTGNLRLDVNTSNDAIRITQLGSGNAFVVEDETNPDSTPFVITASGNVGIGVSNPLAYFHSYLQSGTARMILETGAGNTTVSPLNLWNANSGNGVGTGIVFTAGGDGISSGFIGGLLSRRIGDGTQGRTILRVLRNNVITASAGADLPLYLEGTSGAPMVIMLANVGINTANANANLHVTGTIMDNPITLINSNVTYGSNAAGRVIVSDTTSAVTVTIAPSNDSGFSYTVVRGNTGNVTIANSGVTRFNSAAITSMNVTQYGAITVLYKATNEVILFGDFV